MEFYLFFQFCSKLPDIARNVKNLQNVIDFVGFPGIDGIRATGMVRTTSDTNIRHEMSDYIGIRITLGADMGCKMSDYIGIRPILLSHFCPYAHSAAGGGM